jgi:hypothetical protein
MRANAMLLGRWLDGLSLFWLLQYRARQKRIIANSSKGRHERSRILREVEQALQR